MQKGLVSLLTPMYNTGAYVHRLLDSVLNQTYPRIEMIVIDDGSTDNSAEVVRGYIPRFEEKGYSLKYIYQDNAGQSVAIRNGLKRIGGEFLAWPDSDDYYASEDAIARMVETLSAADPVFQMVRTQEVLVEDGSFRPLAFYGQKAHEEEGPGLFEDCLFGKNDFYFCAGAYMVRTEALYEMTEFAIYTEKGAGQNWQLFLPVLYKYRCKTILSPLFHVVSRSRSHSRQFETDYENLARQMDVYFKTQMETLKRIKGMPEAEREGYRLKLEAYYDSRLLDEAIRGNRRKEAKEKFRVCRAELAAPALGCAPALLLSLPGGTYVMNFIRYAVAGCKGLSRRLFKRK